MTAGNLDRLITVLRSELIDTGFGMSPGPFEPVGTVPAHRADISDGERWRAAEVQASVTTRFTVRSSTFTRAIKPQDRISCEGLDYNISGIKQVPDRRGALLEITASARTDQG